MMFAAVPRHPAWTHATIRVSESASRIGTQSAVRMPAATPASAETIASPSPICSPFRPAASSTRAEWICFAVVSSPGGMGQRPSRSPNPCVSHGKSRFGDVITGVVFILRYRAIVRGLMNSTAGAQSDTDQSVPRLFDLALLGIALICLIPRLLLGASQYIEYDGYWHVWIAQQDWNHFIREYQANAHPPLYFLLLKLSFWLGRTNLAYRSVSIVSGTASIYVLGRTALKAIRSPIWAALAALTYGLALPSILLSNEVRTYMLSALLVQISFYYFLDLNSMRSRILFAATATLACLTEYYALIYVGATLLFALILPILRRDKNWIRALLRELATFVLILALPVWEYISHFGARSVAYDHLPDYYFQPDGAESAIAFLLRNLRNE